MNSRRANVLFLLASIGAILFAGWRWSTPQPPSADSGRTAIDVPYRTDHERGRLDLYVPQDADGFPTVVWFHGGGLTQGNKSIPETLMQQGIAVVAPNYRLSPSAKSPEYIEDAAAAVAWTIRHIESYGGSRTKVFVAGHSAGGYLAAMVGLDRRWLKAHELSPDELAGIIPFSGHSITHFTIRAERGIPEHQSVVDDLAPMYHVRKDAPPMLLITGDRDLEMLGRYEETAYFWRMLTVVGHRDVRLVELKGWDHSGMAGPAFPLLIEFVRNRSAGR